MFTKFNSRCKYLIAKALLFGSFQTYGATTDCAGGYSGIDYNGINSTNTFSQTLYSLPASGEWVEIGELDIGKRSKLTAGPLISAVRECQQTKMCNFICARVGISGRTIAQVKMYTYVHTQDGVSLGIGWNTLPTVAFTQHTHGGYSYDYTYSYWPEKTYGSFDSVPTINGVASSQHQSTAGPTGGDADRYFVAHFNEGSVNPSLFVKLPDNLTHKNYILNDITLMKFTLSAQKASGTVLSAEKELKATVNISVPERCYLNVNDGSLSFGTIKPNSVSSLLSQTTANISTTCYNAPLNTKQTITVSGLGGELNSSGNMLFFDGLNDILGVVYAVNNSNINCDNGEKFNTDMYIREINSTGIMQFNDEIKFGLCKVGNIKKYGNFNIPVRITVKWSIEDV